MRSTLTPPACSSGGELRHHPLGAAPFHAQVQAIAKQLHIFNIFMFLRQVPQRFVRLAHQLQDAPLQAAGHLPRRAFDHHPPAIDKTQVVQRDASSM